MFTALGYYMHEYIRGNAECIRDNVEGMAYMKEPAECEPTPSPMCQLSDTVCLRCMTGIGFQYVRDMINETFYQN